MGIEKLPQELWDKITLECEGDWKQLRQVCRRFEPLATACCFSELTDCIQTRRFFEYNTVFLLTLTTSANTRRLNEVANNCRLRDFVETLTMANGTTENRQCLPSDFMACLQETYFPTYESPASCYRPYDLATYHDNFDSFTIQDFQDFQDYNSTLTEIGIDRNKAFSLYKEKEKRDVFFEGKNRESYNLGISHLSGAMENFPNLTKIKLKDYPIGPSWSELPYPRVRDLARNTCGILLEAAQTSIRRKSTNHPQIIHLEIEHWEPAWGKGFHITTALPFFLHLIHHVYPKTKCFAQKESWCLALYLL
jgi:hypothetical protein